MATKAKPAAASSTLPKDLEAALSKGLAALSGGKPDEAAKVFGELVARSAAEGHVGLERVCRGYLAAAQARLKKPGKEHPDPVLDLSILLNEGESELALERVEKALKAHPNLGPLHYLKATALAQMGRFEEAAESLATAKGLSPDLGWIWRLEPDFARARASSTFARLDARD
jgi:tetratricopeptide (TPR) repeat protein